MPDDVLIEQINQLLPQTQCGLCTYAGCRPYAEAMVKANDRIDRCLPGGVALLKTLGTVLQQDPDPFVADMQTKQKPPQRVQIREEECIGCTKCISACPVDAIVGSAKQMHTVISQECTGCELCIAPCPVDCIDIIALAENPYDKNKALARYQAKTAREQVKLQAKAQRAEKRKIQSSAPSTAEPAITDDIAAKRDYIALAVARAHLKKETRGK